MEAGPLKYYLINLDRSPDRFEFMRVQFNRLGMEVERLRAVVGTDVPAWLEPEFAGPHVLTDGEVGCYASHLCAAQKIVAEGLAHAVILEDDAELDDDFAKVCQAAVKNAPAEWDLIHLSAVVKRPMVGIANLSVFHDLVRYTRNPANTAAYVLSNAGARKMLTPMKRVRPNDMDNRRAWEQHINFLGVYPAPARQAERMKSTMIYNDQWPRGHFDALRSKAWTMREIGVGTYLLSSAWAIRNSVLRRIDGKRRTPVLWTQQP